MKNSTLNDVRRIDIPVIVDEEGRGKLSVVEKDIIPFKIERVYYLYDVPSDAYRGGHAHKELIQLLIPLSGSFDVKLMDGYSTEIIRLNKPNIGLLIPTGIWRELENFSAGAVCLVLASNEFNEADYIWDYNNFVKLKKS